MKKIILVSALAAFAAMPAFAAEEMKAPAAATAATSAMASKKVELKDGSWAMINSDHSVKISKDGGATWMPASDGTWESKDGMTKITTKGGMEVKEAAPAAGHPQH